MMTETRAIKGEAGGDRSQKMFFNVSDTLHVSGSLVPLLCIEQRPVIGGTSNGYIGGTCPQKSAESTENSSLHHSTNRNYLTVLLFFTD